MIRRSTWLALILLAGLAAFTLSLRQKDKTLPAVEASPTLAEQSLFPPGTGTPMGISVTSAEGQAVQLSRGTDGAWVIEQPEPVPADQGQAEAAATQVAALQVVGTADAPLDAVGLEKPAYIVKVAFGGGGSHALEIGDKTPTEAGYYARLDGGSVLIVSEAGVASLLTLLSSPPYKETPTPTSATPPAGSETPASPPATATP